MISIRKHIEGLTGEDKVRRAYRKTLEAILHTTREHILVTDTEEHTWFCTNLENFAERLREDHSVTNVEVVGALVTKTLTDHYAKLSRQTESRDQELKRIISLLAETASSLDHENKQFYAQLGHTVQGFQSISQLEDVAFMRKKLSKQVVHLQETVGRQETVSGNLVSKLQAELDSAHSEIETLTLATTTDPLTQLPTRRAAERLIREKIEREEPFSVAMAVIDRLDIVNLRYGAQLGDTALRRFSGTLKTQLPKRAFLCRWGGPAFVALLDNTPAADLKAAIQKVLAAIAGQPLETEGRSSSLFHITSRYAVHQWVTGQPADKVISLINAFCLAQEIMGADAADPTEPRP